MQSLFQPNAQASAAGDLFGRVALVTGAGRGIGRAIARRLHQGGATVALCGRTRANLDELATELGERVAVGVFDVADRASVDAEVLRLAQALGGRIDIVVNNAGVNGPTPLAGDDDAMWNSILAVNLSGPMYVTRAALPFLKPGASVINLSSVLGKMGVPGKSAYCAAKHGIIGWTRSVALELAPRGIRVNAVCPGWTTSDMADQSVVEAAAFDGVPVEKWRAQAVAAVPQKRFLDAAEVAELVAFLAAPAAAGITAEVYTISGGSTAF